VKAELSSQDWNDVLRRLKNYATLLTKGSVLQGSADDADDLVAGAVKKWLNRGLAWKDEQGSATVEAVVGYLKPAVRNLFLDRLKRSAAKYEAPPLEAEELTVTEEISLLREYLDHLVRQLRPYIKDDALAELYIDLQLSSEEFLSDQAAATALGDDITVTDIRNMKKRLKRYVRDMNATVQTN
jgi:hypothetical protein